MGAFLTQIRDKFGQLLPPDLREIIQDFIVNDGLE
jgi:hypothetical protein